VEVRRIVPGGFGRIGTAGDYKISEKIIVIDQGMNLNPPGGPLAKVRCAPIANKFRIAPK
jgi:hypothetical protein